MPCNVIIGGYQYFGRIIASVFMVEDGVKRVFKCGHLVLPTVE